MFLNRIDVLVQIAMIYGYIDIVFGLRYNINFISQFDMNTSLIDK